MKERDVVIDIESCPNTIKEAGCPDVSNDKLGNTISFTVCGIDEFANCENTVNPSSDVKIVKLEKKDGEKEKRFSMGGAKKPPKPPRPPRGLLSLDAADQKLVKEISELAMIKRARIERMKALKKTKVAKASSGSSGNLIAILFTLLFCIAVIFQGCHPLRILPSNSSAVEIKRATESNVVGVVDQRNSSTASAHASSDFGSPSFMDLAPYLDNKDDAKKSLY